MTTQQILQGVHDWTNGKIVYDISVAHPDGQGKPTPYADLTAALGTGGANIPEPLRKGGMSVKFIQGNAQSSDNKYLQYRLTADEFTTDTTQWAIVEEGVYVENPEFIYVKTDAEGRILWAIKTDGSIYYGAGVPQQVIDYINEKIAELSLDEYENIVTFLGDLIEGDKTLQELLSEKVDKEEGKSLIPTQYIREVESPEYVDAKTDNNDKLLEGNRKDGTKVFGGDVEIQGAVTSKEVLADKMTLNGKEISTVSTVEVTEIIEDIENRSELKIDDKEKVISYRDEKGVLHEEAGIKSKEISSDKILLNGIEMSPVSTVDVTEIIKDPESRTEIKTDSEEKIISYRSEDGTLHENIGFETPTLRTNSLNLTEQGMTEFQQALKDAGFHPGGGGDFTDKPSMQIPMPHIAFVNITAPNGNAVWPTSKTNDYHYYMEFYDGAGNYFKKEIILNAQGRSSMGHPKKNGAADFCNNNGWDDDDTFKIKFGDWVAQDSFHFKGYWTDFFRGINAIAYDFANMLWENRGLRADRPWKKALIDFDSIGRDYRDTWNKDNMALQMDNGARCIPDGFPAVFYLNGEFYGVYSWQLKKHRDNYHMKKDEPKHIHLDGVISWTVLFGANGDSSKINWSPAEYQGFEVRNPKDVWTVAGNKYDGDLDESQELVDTATAEDWITAGVTPAGVNVTSKIAKQLRYTGKVKKYILDFSEVIPTLKSMKDGGSTDAEIKEYYEEHFDVDNIIDYILFSAILYNYDGFSGNWQWTTWDGVKWYICPYDCDGILGQQEAGNYIMNVNARLFKTGTESASNLNDGFNYPIKWVTTYYKTELAARWAEIKQLGCVDFFMKHLTDWMNRIGQDNYEKEFKKWNTTPSNRDSNVNAEYWEFAGERSNNDSWVAATGKVYDDTKQYSVYSSSESVDNTCWFKQGYWYKFRCVSACVGEKPLDTSKPALGFHDSIWRAQNMIEHLYGGIDSLITNI